MFVKQVPDPSVCLSTGNVPEVSLGYACAMRDSALQDYRVARAEGAAWLWRRAVSRAGGGRTITLMVFRLWANCMRQERGRRQVLVRAVARMQGRRAMPLFQAWVSYVAMIKQERLDAIVEEETRKTEAKDQHISDLTSQVANLKKANGNLIGQKADLEAKLEAMSNDSKLSESLKKEVKNQKDRADAAEASLVQLYETLELVVRTQINGLRTRLLNLSSSKERHDLRPVLSERTKQVLELQRPRMDDLEAPPLASIANWDSRGADTDDFSMSTVAESSVVSVPVIEEGDEDEDEEGEGDKSVTDISIISEPDADGELAPEPDSPFREFRVGDEVRVVKEDSPMGEKTGTVTDGDSNGMIEVSIVADGSEQRETMSFNHEDIVLVKAVKSEEPEEKQAEAKKPPPPRAVQAQASDIGDDGSIKLDLDQAPSNLAELIVLDWCNFMSQSAGNSGGPRLDNFKNATDYARSFQDGKQLSRVLCSMYDVSGATDSADKPSQGLSAAAASFRQRPIVAFAAAKKEDQDEYLKKVNSFALQQT